MSKIQEVGKPPTSLLLVLFSSEAKAKKEREPPIIEATVLLSWKHRVRSEGYHLSRCMDYVEWCHSHIWTMVVQISRLAGIQAVTSSIHRPLTQKQPSVQNQVWSQHGYIHREKFTWYKMAWRTGENPNWGVALHLVSFHHFNRSCFDGTHLCFGTPTWLQTGLPNVRRRHVASSNQNFRSAIHPGCHDPHFRLGFNHGMYAWLQWIESRVPSSIISTIYPTLVKTRLNLLFTHPTWKRKIFHSKPFYFWSDYEPNNAWKTRVSSPWQTKPKSWLSLSILDPSQGPRKDL